jgi:hypothetical protein
MSLEPRRFTFRPLQIDFDHRMVVLGYAPFGTRQGDVLDVDRMQVGTVMVSRDEEVCRLYQLNGDAQFTHADKRAARALRRRLLEECKDIKPGARFLNDCDILVYDRAALIS